ncbi:MAG: O-methyltransferase [Bacteroidales bacterium]|nr:O-methyltransferase [Bacteroidales bacterium]
MEITEKLKEYAEAYTTPETDVLKKLNRETNAKILRARMLSGHLQGKLLETFSKMLKPKRILEIGTYTGYSAICLAQGLTDDGIIYTIDKNKELEDFVRPYFKEANLEKKIKYIIGNAADVIPTINEMFDLVFIDADKENNCIYFDMVIDKLNPGGYIIADNALWDGKVLEEPNPNDTETIGVINFNNKVKNDTSVEHLLLPFRDGLMIVRKK